MNLKILVNKQKLIIGILGDFTNVRFIDYVKIYNNTEIVVFELCNNKADNMKFYDYIPDLDKKIEIPCNVADELSDGYILTFDINTKDGERIHKRYIFENGKFSENHLIEKIKKNCQ